MMERPGEKTRSSTAGILIGIIRTFALFLLLTCVIPGLLIGWGMGVQSCLERLGYAKSTYSKFAYYVVVDDVSLYEKELSSSIVESHGRIFTHDCKQKDKIIDGGDGPDKGKFRWYVCWGKDCDEGWEGRFEPPSKNTGVPAGTVRVIVILIAVLAVGSIIAVPIGFAVRIVRGIFSSAIRKKIGARPLRHILWFIFSLVIIFPLFFIQRIQMPVDADVTEHFHKNKVEFTRLVGMLSEDADIQYVSNSLVSPSELIEDERLGEYRDLIDRAGLLCISSNWGRTQEITFRRKDAYVNAKFVKGYVYSTGELKPMRDSLDDGYKDVPPKARIYKKIENDWYIYLENQRD